MSCELSVDLKIKEILSSVLSIPLGLINDSSSPIDHEQWDSLRHMNLIAAIEDQFGLFFSDEEMSKMTNLKNIIFLVKAKQG
jgi:acyl carrier protein